MQVKQWHNGNQAGFSKLIIYTKSYHTSNLLSNNSKHISLVSCHPTIYIYIQGVTGGMCETSGECSLC